MWQKLTMDEHMENKHITKCYVNELREFIRQSHVDSSTMPAWERQYYRALFAPESVTHQPTQPITDVFYSFGVFDQYGGMIVDWTIDGIDAPNQQYIDWLGKKLIQDIVEENIGEKA